MTTVFVFGSNTAGRHGKGAALYAAKHYGAQIGVGQGRTGDAYAIPTKDKHLRVLDLETINSYVRWFVRYAFLHPDIQFNVTAIGTGLAGYSHDQIAPMFSEAPLNCVMPEAWASYYPEHKRWKS